jgi:hypothetical protein
MSLATDAMPARASAFFNEAGDDGMTPLAVMLATMRWAHAAAEAACAHMAELAGQHAVVAAKGALALRAFALKTAKAAAPYVHARLRAAAANDNAGVHSHEAWVAEFEREEREEAERAKREATQKDGASADAWQRDAAPEPGGAPRAPSAGATVAPAPEPQPGAVSLEQRAAQGAGATPAAARPDARASPAPPRRYPRKRTPVPSPWAL